MKRNKQISVRLTEEEFNMLKANAEGQEMEVSEYIREASCYRDANWISKQFVVKHLERIQKILDRYEMKDKKIIRLIYDEVKKIWMKM